MSGSLSASQVGEHRESTVHLPSEGVVHPVWEVTLYYQDRSIHCNTKRQTWGVPRGGKLPVGGGPPQPGEEVPTAWQQAAVNRVC